MSKNKKEFKAVAVGCLAPKSVFTYGGVSWVALQHIGGGVLCLAEKVLFNKAFDDDNYNNWEDSSLREHLNNDFLEECVLNGAEETAFLPMVTDLTADDGLKDYGSCEDVISLISCQQYRKYRGIIPNADGWWWTCTAYSTKANGYSYYARYVNSDGSLNYYNACLGYNGVRTLCTLQSSILVSPTHVEEDTYTQLDGEDVENYEADSETTTEEITPEWFADDIRTQKAIDGFYECIEVAQQRYKEGAEDFTKIIQALQLIKYLKGDMPF